MAHRPLRMPTMAHRPLRMPKAVDRSPTTASKTRQRPRAGSRPQTATELSPKLRSQRPPVREPWVYSPRLSTSGPLGLPTMR